MPNGSSRVGLRVEPNRRVSDLRGAEASAAFDQAIALVHTPAEAAHIRMLLDHVMKDSQSV